MLLLSRSPLRTSSSSARDVGLSSSPSAHHSRRSSSSKIPAPVGCRNAEHQSYPIRLRRTPHVESRARLRMRAKVHVDNEVVLRHSVWIGIRGRVECANAPVKKELAPVVHLGYSRCQHLRPTNTAPRTHFTRAAFSRSLSGWPTSTFFMDLQRFLCVGHAAFWQVLLLRGWHSANSDYRQCVMLTSTVPTCVWTAISITAP
jgi:hypothetical protein